LAHEHIINMKNKKTQSGSALLITILLMGLLITITLALSSLVIREISVTQSIVNANKAFYAAEAGVENALYDLSTHGPGYEPSPTSENTQLENSGTEFKYEISNRADKLPFFDDKNPIYIVDTGDKCTISDAGNPFAIAVNKNTLYAEHPQCTYRRLGLNQTVVVPLFITNSDGNVTDASDFMVQYYLPFDHLENEFRNIELKNFDILRWKIYGSPINGDTNKTESIADFYPAIDGSSSKDPVCIGTFTESTSDQERCHIPVIAKKSGASDDQDDDYIANAARECYMTDAGALVTSNLSIKGTTSEGGKTGVCVMKDFTISHKNNYLILTNMINPQLVGINDPLRQDLSNADIYYRVVTRDNELLPKDYAEIRADGFAANGTVVKSLDVNYRPKDYLPVFNFSLYRTSDKPVADGSAGTP
jgi:hypothetical protein